MQHILKDVQHIDLFILNIEGDEVEALVTMDWNLEVDYWITEIDNSNSEKERAVSDLSQGYVPTKWDIRTACVKGMDCGSHRLFSRRNI